ncbi:peptidoglycan bridge formation glycyltransferase FemA/FemB family protein [Nocardioides zeae]|uniref:Peptidoglycan bridge formation glycyltransferase FemA/FemB family protein n=1 Tax=Nocardioides imazamoxiresistens TaxID=3231893 RepID=A0ABU3PVU8_9ACTN|nr:peptidoglycan bridge formation glycyltransferase FemA/FemB family protein [Nocardioides zeae]MDT9592947.1 peptidoglycan bridge formation glycyltransferase FemA/FemB family protein [Nocardioides zeae]
MTTPPLTSPQTAVPAPSGPLAVRTISADEHRSFVASRRSVSFLQTPGWGAVKAEWRHESIGWFDGTELVGAALVLYRQVPRLKRYLAYLPEGPVIGYADGELAAWLTPMTAHLKRQGAFGIRIGPPVVLHRWDAAGVKEGIASDEVSRLGELPPYERSAEGATVVSQLHELGWQKLTAEGGFSAGQPAFNFQIPLRRPSEAGDGTTEPRSEADVLKGMNQLWRRNVKKADKAGVEVTTATDDEALAAFHELYVHTAERDRFTPRPLAYFRTMRDALNADEAGRFTFFLAHHEGELVAATIAIRVGAHYWYSYGASSTVKRDVRGSNAVQWAMIRAALDAGCDVYDLRGITETLDADDAHVGLIQFKVGTGGEAVEYAGEWDLPVNRLLYRAFDLYMNRRG